MYTSTQTTPEEKSPAQKAVCWPRLWAGKTRYCQTAKGHSPESMENYMSAVKRFTSVFKKHPKNITENEVKEYLHSLTCKTRYAPATYNLHVCQTMRRLRRH